MEGIKKIGVYMDHTIAHFIEMSPENLELTIITSKFSQLEKVESLKRSEKIMHSLEQREEANYYTEICEVLKDYKEILLFGPTNAKLELRNILRSNHLFDSRIIEVKNTDHLTENQEYAFVREHFFDKH